MKQSPTRCSWATNDPINIDYHDNEWGIPIHEDQHLFEMLCLEGAQAGLSWITILKKRNHYRTRFHQFNIQQCSQLTDQHLEDILTDSGVVRNRLKIYSIRTNALATLNIIKEFGSFNHYIWQWVNHQPIINQWNDHANIPASTPLSTQISKDLKARGFTFVGPTIIYAFMQAAGLVNDHTLNCFCRN